MATSAVGVRFPEHLVKHEEAWEGCGHVQVVHMLLQHLITDDAVMREGRAYAFEVPGNPLEMSSETPAARAMQPPEMYTKSRI